MNPRSAEFAPLAPLLRPESKLRVIPRKVHQAIELIATGRVKSIKAAAERVGYARETLSKHLSRPECTDAMKARAAKEVALGSGRAAARLNEIMEGPSAKAALDAVKYSLGVAGIKPAADSQVNVNLEIRAGYVIDLSEPDRPMKIVSGGEAKAIDAKAE
jgi:hypothetical protein